MAVTLSFARDGLEQVVERATCVIQQGGILGIPTESVYALAGSPFRSDVVERIRSMKGRPDGKPILVLIAHRSQLPSLVREIPPAATFLMERFWPGALTLTFPALASLPDAVTAGTGTVGVRIPAYTPLTALLRLAGPLTGTSANRSGALAAETAEQLQSSFGDRIDLILDGGPTSATVPSTLVDTANTMQVLREGPISREAIEAALRAGGFLRE